MQQAGNDYPVEADALSAFFARTSLRTLYCHSEIAVWLYVLSQNAEWYDGTLHAGQGGASPQGVNNDDARHLRCLDGEVPTH